MSAIVEIFTKRIVCEIYALLIFSSILRVDDVKSQRHNRMLFVATVAFFDAFQRKLPFCSFHPENVRCVVTAKAYLLIEVQIIFFKC
ncbi:hypothetical protein T4D_4687 [Trichinella pseudospiralis]|uniref:Uncharacterized protein n=1 Tax=Trichinella pseudospiralis TaxID=6337 RepID=A0A0V1FZJ2_TRIPS|nr:hypothetical protein T4D_4687 [Trichinella pseudospiralis]